MATLDRDFVRAHHLHSEVEPEEVIADHGRLMAGGRVFRLPSRAR